jgi:phosphoglycerate dehydrogenase-like enzyme
LIAAVRDAAALVVRNTITVDRALVDAAPALVAIGRLGTGLENIDVAYAHARGIAVVDAGDANANAVAEYVFAALLSLERDLDALHAAVRAGAWPRFDRPTRELAGTTLGVAGLGRSGSRVARIGRALGMHVIGFRRTPGLPDDLARLGIERVDKDDLLARSDYLVLLLPPLPDAHAFVGASEFARMRDDAVLVNAGRGSLVDERALLAALETDRLRAAVLDTRTSEPPEPHDALTRHPRVVSTPHVAGLTREAQARVTATIAARIERVLRTVGPQPPR